MTKVLSKDSCIYCTRAKALLDSKDVEYTELKLDRDITREEFFAMIPAGAMTFPQIWLTIADAEVYIGGYDKLVEYFESN